MDTARLQAIANNLTNITGYGIKICVEDSSKIDAYLHPAGHIVITTGLMNFFEDDAEMAFIIGHELSHMVSKHYKSGSEILGISTDIYFPDSLRQEMEADEYSLKIMKAAGYDPAASLRVLAKIRVNAAGQLSSYLEKRINALAFADGN
ncbi:MAG: M48 family metalloprotease [Deltaproteobacteria bacterium]|nr:M48 family metalloprotease [Deltaproteobacteria bacterium]